MGSNYGKDASAMSSLKTSPSKVRNFVKCPLRYHLQVTGAARGGGVSGFGSGSPALAIDRFLHTALDGYHKEKLQKCGPPPERLEELLRQIWKEDLFSSVEESREALDRAMVQLRRYRAVQAASSARVAAAKTFCGTAISGVWINAVVDRIDELPGGGLELIDFKSGRPPATDFFLKRDIAAAMTFFAAAGDRKLARLGEPLRLTFWYLQNQQRISLTFGDRDFQRVEETLDRLKSAAESDEFPSHRGPGCRFCDWLENCSAWPKTPRELAGESPEEYSQRLRTSYSMLSSYQRCPRAYHKVYVERVRGEPKPYFDLGNAIHGTLESFHAPGYQGEETLEGLLSIYQEEFFKYQEGYRSEGEKARYQEKGLEMLRQYHGSFVAPTGRIVAHGIEEFFEYPVGQQAILNGFIDRVDRDETGKLTVWDYKTESNRRTQEEVDGDFQLGIYAWACKQQYGQNVDLGIYMLAHGQALKTRRTDEQLEEVESQVLELVGQIRSDEEFLPKLNKFCPNCDFLGDCPLKADVDAAIANGKLTRAGFEE